MISSTLKTMMMTAVYTSRSTSVVIIDIQEKLWHGRQKIACTVANVNGKIAIVQMFRIVLAGCVYLVWQERNNRVSQGKSRTPNVFTRLIVQQVVARGCVSRRLASRIGQLKFYSG